MVEHCQLSEGSDDGGTDTDVCTVTIVNDDERRRLAVPASVATLGAHRWSRTTEYIASSQLGSGSSGSHVDL